MATSKPIGPKFDVSVDTMDQNTRWRFCQENFKQLYSFLFGYSGFSGGGTVIQDDSFGFSLMLMD